MLEHWNLPEEIVNAVRWHHKPEEYSANDESRTVIDLVHAADVMIMMSGIASGSDGLNYKTSPGVVGRLSLNTTNIEQIMVNIMSEMDRFRSMFDVSGT